MHDRLAYSDTPLDLTYSHAVSTRPPSRGLRSANHTDPLRCLISCKPPNSNPIWSAKCSLAELPSTASRRDGKQGEPPKSLNPSVAHGANAVAPTNDHDSWHDRTAVSRDRRPGPAFAAIPRPWLSRDSGT